MKQLNQLEKIQNKDPTLLVGLNESKIKNDYKTFWDDSCELISSSLLSHIQIDSADLETCLSK